MNIDWKELLLSFNGRTGKRDFWIGFAALFGAGIVASMLPLVGALASLALLYPWTALLTKRLHDFGRSGWLVLIPAAPAALSGVLAAYTAYAMSNAATMGSAFAAAGFAVLISTVAMIVGLGFLIWAGTRDGDEGVNAFGPAASALAH